MKVVIIGAGGIGCYYGARLLAAGHQVTFVARGAHLLALQTQGLTVIHPKFDFHQPVQALAVEQLIETTQCADYDIVVIAAKSGATRELMSQMKAWLAPASTPVLSIQNGVMNEACIANTVGKARTIGGLAVLIGGHLIEPGVAEVAGESHLELGAWPNWRDNPFPQTILELWVAEFNRAGIPTQNFADIQYALWRKLIINNGVNPLTALTYLDTQSLLSDATLRETCYQMMVETGRAARRAGVNIQTADVDAMFQLICEFDAIKTSMLVDREKGRPMEIDAICGPVIDYCQMSGEPARTTELIASLLKHAARQSG